ncbi:MULTISPECIES: peptidoglycan-binding domain-containing protein [Calothrix]|uniref:Peptidoglycan-binding protein n=2 Tax=Calothrix TaxID=1186 RepID=A0ABR8AHZ4_9CYAN|nr:MULTISPECIES: peptidoglycan-binding protein [Calothrix]MBD2199546.1 peptidoglycan-binding protein [Calothrix parietina FACHB-288]MBD2228301.1 peptidoglycan-binding protein [Calothrix anomala FACHB-343]
MNPQLISSKTLPLGLISALFIGMLPFNFAPAQAQVNSNGSIVGRLSKYNPVNAPFLRVGSRGQPVRDVQAVLQNLGFYQGAIDGIYGLRTARAVAAFQRSQRLVGDGRVGALTWQALRDRTNAAPLPGPF